jgi:hypothetical protein
MGVMTGESIRRMQWKSEGSFTAAIRLWKA